MVPGAACAGGAKFYGQQHGYESFSRSDWELLLPPLCPSSFNQD